MESITHIFNCINTFSEINFKFSKYIDLFSILKEIPDFISSRLNDNNLIFHLKEAISHTKWLILYFEKNINPKLRKEMNHLSNSKIIKKIPDALKKVSLNKIR